MTYYIDIPNHLDIYGSWVNIGSFDTEEDALGFIENIFGSPDGRIQLISNIDDSEEDEEEGGIPKHPTTKQDLNPVSI